MKLVCLCRGGVLLDRCTAMGGLLFLEDWGAIQSVAGRNTGAVKYKLGSMQQREFRSKRCWSATDVSTDRMDP